MNDVQADAKAIFLEALDCKGDDELTRFLEQACGSDAALRMRVEELLRAHRDAGAFLGGAEKQPATCGPSSAERPGAVIGPYKLLQQLGEGGMGVVYMAEQTKPVRRMVALKVIKPGMDSQQVIARFEAERQALAMMDHVHIARVLDAGATASGRPYFVMELVHGVPITKYCDDNHLTPRQRLELFLPVCQAIQHAHQKGIIHRDIKPSNIMVTLYDGRPVAKVIDFGVAKATEQRLTERTLFTQYGTLVGTFEYMSPEQAEMSALGVDTRSDIYSLGVVLYELLTGSTPLTHKHATEAAYAEILRRIKEDEPPKPSTRLSDSGEALASISAQRSTEPAKLATLMRGELDWIVMKCLEKDRNRRYETANSFSADLVRYLNDEPVQACPPSIRYRFGKLARRNKTTLVVTGLVLFFLMLMGTGLGWAVRDRAAREAMMATEAASRRARLNFEVEHVLDDAAKAHEESLALTDNPDQWKAALNKAAYILQRAKGLAAQDEAASEPSIRERIESLEMRVTAARRDVFMLDELEGIRLRQAESKDGQMFDRAGAEKRYAAAFLAYGLDVATLEPAQAAARVRESPIREALLAGLDAWLQFEPAESSVRARLRAVADGADDSAWRRAVREAVLAGDTKKLKSLASEPETLDQPQDVLARLGAVLKGAGLREQAEALLRRAQQRYPADFWINYELGHFLVFNSPQRLDEAVSYIRAAVGIRPRSAEARSILGVSFLFKRDYDRAIAYYQQAIALDPRFAGAHINLGVALRYMGRLDEAIAAEREALRLRPDLDEPRQVLDGILLDRIFHADAPHLAGMGQTEKAEVHLAKMIELSPDDVMLRYFRTVVRAFAGDLAGYRGDCAAMLDRFGDTDKPEVAHWLAWAAVLAPQAVNRPDRPVALAAAAVASDPNDGRFSNTLGAALYRAGRFDDAVAKLNQVNAAWEQAATKPIDYSPAYSWFFLALAHQQLGHAEEARRWFDKAVAWAQQEIKSEGVAWNRRLTLELLRREAESVINGAADSPPATAKEDTTEKN